MSKCKTSKTESAPKRQNTREINPKKKNTSRGGKNQSTTILSRQVNVSGEENDNNKPSKSVKDTSVDTSKTSTKLKKSHEEKSTFVVKFKKDAIVSLFAKKTEAPFKKSGKQSTSFIEKAKNCHVNDNDDVATFPKEICPSKRFMRKRQREDYCNDREQNRTTNGLVTCNGTIKNQACRKRLTSKGVADDDVQQMAEVEVNTQPLTVEKKNASKKMRVQRKSNLSDAHSSNALTASRKTERLPSPDTPHTSIKGGKLKEEYLSKANGLNISKKPAEKCLLQDVTKRSKSLSQGVEPTSSLGTHSYSFRTRRAFNRQPSTEMKSSGESLVPQIIIEKEPLNNISNCKPINDLTSNEDLSKIQSDTPLDRAKVMITSDCTMRPSHYLNLDEEELLFCDSASEDSNFFSEEECASDTKQTLNVNLSEYKGYSSRTELNPMFIKLSSGDASDLHSLLKDQDSTEKSIKTSLANESMSTSSQVLDTNGGAVQILAPRPKLTKLNILKIRQKSKIVKSNKKRAMIKPNCNDGFERIVAFVGKKQNVTNLKITKVFSGSSIEVPQKNVLEKEKNVTVESCVAKQNITNVSNSKCNEIFPPINKEMVQPKLVHDKPLLVVNDKLHQRTNLQLNKIIESKVTGDPGDNAINAKLKNNFASKMLKTPITFNNDFGSLSSNYKVEQSKIREVVQHGHKGNEAGKNIEVVQHGHKGNEAGKNIQSALGTKEIRTDKKKTVIEVIHQKSGDAQNCFIEKLKQSDQCSRNIMPKNNNGFEKAVNFNPPCRSMNNGLNQELYSIDFSFAVPKPLPQTKVNQTPIDEDDQESILSISVPDNYLNDVLCDEKMPEQSKKTWKKFDRYSRKSDEEFVEEDHLSPGTSRQDSYMKFSCETVVHSSKNIVHKERKAPSNNLSRIEKCNFWNQMNENFINKGYVRDQNHQNISFRRNTNNQIQDSTKKSSQDSLIKDYCLLYLRSSNESHTGCYSIHEVPHHIFSTPSIQDEEKIESAINEILKDNFKNPPLGLVSAIVSYCVQSRTTNSEIRTPTLVSFAKCLKHVNRVNAIQHWYTFLTAIIDSQSIVSATAKFNIISTVLGQIFEERIDLLNEDLEVFKLIQKALIEVHTVSKSKVQLLSCVAFISEMKSKNRFDLKHIYPEFAISVVKQCSDAINYKHESTWKKFAFKVLSTFLSNYSFVEVLFRHDKHAIIKFFEMVELHQVVDWPSHNYHKIKRLLSTNEFAKPPSSEEMRQSQPSSPLSYHLTEIFSNNHTMDSAPDLYRISTGLVRCYDMRKLDVKEVYSYFKSPPNRKEMFLHCLTSLREDVKKFLSDVIMSFMTDEADNEQWDNCYKLFNSLSPWDFKRIQNLKENTSPTSNVLYSILVLLKKNKITEAFDLFCEYELWKPEGDWILNHIPEDAEKNRNICLIFETAIKFLDIETFYLITIKLVSVQVTLAKPINLVENVSGLIQQLIESRQHAKVVQLLKQVFDQRKSKLLTLPSAHFYRVLVVILCQEGDMVLASMLFFRAIDHVDIYPTTIKNTTAVSSEREMCVQLHSSLRSEEMKVIANLILQVFGKTVQNVGFFVKFMQCFNCFQQEVPGPLKRYLFVQDPSISNGLKRFRESVRELIPNAVFKLRGNDGIEIEKISLKEFMYNQNE